MKARIMQYVAVLAVSLAGTGPAVAQQTITAAELLDKYTQALDLVGGSYIVKAEVSSEHDWAYTKNWPEPGFRGQSDKGKSYHRFEYRTDGKRSYLRDYHWGHINPTDSNVPETEPMYRCALLVNGRYYQHTARLAPGLRGLVKIHESPESMLGSDDAGLQGYFLGKERLDAILRKAKRLAVRPNTERIADSECWVIDAETDNSRISVWIDPAHGFHPARVDAVSTGTIPAANKRVKEVVRSHLEVTRFEKVEGVWLPMEAERSGVPRYADGSYTGGTSRYKRVQITLRPDHDALGSFDNPLEQPGNDPELKNGTHLRTYQDDQKKKFIQKKFIWQDGKLVPDETVRR